MLNFMRNKLISVARKDPETLFIHGVLDDDIYGLEIDLQVRLADLTFLFIDGRWNRHTTPECPRSLEFLQAAVGFRIEDGIDQKIHKIIGRKSCRHFANLLIECCRAAGEAARIAAWKEAAAKRPGLTFSDFAAARTPTERPTPEAAAVRAAPAAPRRQPSPPEGPAATAPAPNTTGGFVIDLHVHTSPASPCASDPVAAMIAEAQRIGLDGICLTDHNFVWPPEHVEALRQKHGFLVLAANEIITDQGDMLVFGFARDIKGVIPLAELRREVDRAGGMIIAAHPFRGFLTFGAGEIGLTVEKAMARPCFQLVNGLETLNGKVTAAENKLAAVVARGLNLPASGGSDAHRREEVGTYATRFEATIGSEADLLAALKTGRFAPLAFRQILKAAAV
ncbi:MAG TPA: PHP domain-containing protein [Desulfobacterales bacterium]|nr:PHP domain-containing protein [Desulfobacterales bacterium]